MNKLAHINIFWGYQAGIINKLESLAKTSIDNKIPIDFILITTRKKELETLKYLKVYFIKDEGNIFKKRKLQIDILNNIEKKYYKLIMRYPLFDPVVLFFLKNKKKYIFEHHTKEIEELKLKNDKRYLFEKYFGSKWLNLFGGIIGVTKEIENYELKRSRFERFHSFVPNSIIIDNRQLEGEIYSYDKIHIIMVANFRPWHGLEKIISEIEKNEKYRDKFVFHIVGEINNKILEEKIKKNSNIKYYGFLQKEQIQSLYKNMDVGLGVFNLAVKGMKESTSLKVREYFANGLLVYTGDIDPAFPKDFRYLIQNKEFKLDILFDFVVKHKGVKKEYIRNEVKKFIDSKIILNNLYKNIVKEA